MGIGAAIAGSAVLGVAGSAISAGGAQSAASKQAAAAQQASLLDWQRYQQTRGDLVPYNNTGQGVLGSLGNYYVDTQGALNTAFNNAQGAIPKIPDQATLLNYPGYAFSLDSGLKALQAQETGRGLGLSGGGIKAAQNFATGLANQYANQYFTQGQTQFTDQAQQLQNQIGARNAVFNQIYSPASLGENAGAMTGSTGANLAQAQGNALMAAGQAQAAGIGTAAGALNQGLSGVGNNLLTYAMLNKLGSQQPTPVDLGGGGSIQGTSYPSYGGPSGISPSVDQALGY